MENRDALQKATDKGDRKVIREHAWRLWAGIMQPAPGLDWPIWYTWPNTYGAFQPGVPEPTAAAKPAPASAPARSITARNRDNAPHVNTPAPIYPLPKRVKTVYKDGVCNNKEGKDVVCDGKTFVNNGDIMIATESLSKEAMRDIRSRQIYLQGTLNREYEASTRMIEVNDRFIVTKHMYWPVSGSGVSPLPVWHNDYKPEYTGYAGYETWKTIIGIDPSGKAVGRQQELSFLFGVKRYDGTPMPTRKAKARVYGIEDFYHHRVTQKDWDNFSEADKANLNAASNWSYNKDFGVGDYLVTVAMHVNTKELDSWTLQSVWWSDKPDHGEYASHRPKLPQAQGPWQHYLMTDSYAVPPNKDGKLNIAVNPYIEGVIHPIATSTKPRK